MKAYKDQNNKFYSLLYIQNPTNPKGGATPYIEPTWWFQPMRVKMQGRIPAGLEIVPGAWPQPIAENLVGRLLTEFTGRVSALPSDTPTKADPGPKQKGGDD